MAENDPYQPPSAELRAPVQVGPEGGVIATRVERLVAAIIDGVIMLAIVIPIQWSMGVFENPEASSGLAATVGWLGGGFVITMLVQGYFLATRAQTIGKIALKIKIVTLDGKNADLTRILVRRILPVTLVSAIPLVGGVLSLVDALFIFRDDQRCIHDLIAETRVVKA